MRLLAVRFAQVPRGRVMRGLLRGLDLFAGHGVTCSWPTPSLGL